MSLTRRKLFNFLMVTGAVTMTSCFYYTCYYSTKSIVIKTLSSEEFAKLQKILHEVKTGRNSEITVKSPPPTSKNKILLFWTKHYSTKETFMQPLSRKTCPSFNCEITMDRDYLNVSDAILFHWYSVNMNDLPKHRTKDQLWILYNREAPPLTPVGNTKKLGPLINYTATYRLESDILVGYGKLRKKTEAEKAETSFEMKSFINNKTSLVAWMVSHCKTPSNRESFVRELEKVIPVDKYGRCGNLRCPNDAGGRNNGTKRLECYRYIGRKYKFYLSFENSICKDYVTEKFFSALDAGVVPVVLGGADYEKYVPKGSYINALDFPSPEKLGEYLLNVASNESLYASYLEWKKDYIVEMDHYGSTWGCELCRRVNNVETKPNAWNDLTSWYLKGAHCQKWSTDFKKSQEK